MNFVSPFAGTPSPNHVVLIGLPQAYAWAVFALLVTSVMYTAFGKGPYDAIPAIGGNGFVSSYISAIRFPKFAKEWIQIGYEKHRPGIFRIPQINRWHIIVSGEKLIEELRKAPDDTLDHVAAAEELILDRHLIGPNILVDRYHVSVLRAHITQNLGALFPDVRDEVMRAFDDNITPSEGWTKVIAYDAALQIIVRASNRIFVGAPVCRNPEYITLNIKHTIHVVKGSRTLAYCPIFLKPLTARLFTDVPNSIRLALKHLKPLITERQQKIDEYGRDYPEKPNDALSWLMDEAVGEERKPENLTNRILHLNFVAIHTSSMSFTHALFHLAAQPQYIEPIRKEVESVIAEEGWTKVAMSRLRKLDSFFKESQRFNGLRIAEISRKARKAFTFSDGTLIPKGALISAAAHAQHHDDRVYANGDTFDGFRFSDIHEEGGQGAKNQFAATSAEYIAFGHGRHACPGRFFAANELKVMMAHLVLTYDIKMENEGVRPENQWDGLRCTPDTKAQVLFRRRQT